MEITEIWEEYREVIMNLIKRWKYVVSKLDFGNRCCTNRGKANCKADDALLAQRSVEYALVAFTEQLYRPRHLSLQVYVTDM